MKIVHLHFYKLFGAARFIRIFDTKNEFATVSFGEEIIVESRAGAPDVKIAGW
jgi:hypothetical protein